MYLAVSEDSEKLKKQLSEEIEVFEELQQELIDGKRRDHDHLTGEFQGAAHSICDLNYKIPNFIPVFFHNFSGYDAHFLVKELEADGENITLIPTVKKNIFPFQST